MLVGLALQSRFKVSQPGKTFFAQLNRFSTVIGALLAKQAHLRSPASLFSCSFLGPKFDMEEPDQSGIFFIGFGSDCAEASAGRCGIRADTIGRRSRATADILHRSIDRHLDHEYGVEIRYSILDGIASET